MKVFSQQTWFDRLSSCPELLFIHRFATNNTDTASTILQLSHLDPATFFPEYANQKEWIKHHKDTEEALDDDVDMNEALKRSDHMPKCPSESQ
jgi:hypothetical protein